MACGNDFDGALGFFKMAISICEELGVLFLEGDQSKMDSRKLSFFETQEKTYELLQMVHVRLKDVDRALEVCERGRTRALLDRLSVQGKKRCTVERMKEISHTCKATIVVYQSVEESAFFQKEGEAVDDSESSEALYIWVVCDDNDVIFRKVEHKYVGKAADDFVMEMHSTMRNVKICYDEDEEEDSDTDFLRQLYDLLVKPIEDLLPSSPNRHVVIIPQVIFSTVRAFLVVVVCSRL